MGREPHLLCLILRRGNYKIAFYNPGDINIESVVIAGKKGTFDATNLFQQLNIYEDLMIPGLNASIVLFDDKNLQQLLPLIGEEILYVSYNTPSLGSFRHTFAISSMTDASPSSALKMRSYLIEAVAEEVYRNKSTLVQKSYKTNLDKIVKDVFENFLKSNKNLSTEETKGIQEYIITNERPFDAINRIRKRSASTSHPSSSYLFFENQMGYHYDTLESLFEKGKVAEYDNSDVGADDVVRRVNFRTVLGYNLPDVYNTSMKIGQGAFSSNMKVLDFKSLLFSSEDKKPENASGRSSGDFKKAMDKSGISSFIPKDLDKPDTFIDKFIPDQRSYLAEVDQCKLHLKIFGDSTLTVGQKIFVHIVVNDGSSGSRQNSAQFAGEYVISKLNSVIYPADIKPRFVQLVEGVSNGVSIE